ncbi:hypothetical protein I5D01_10685 [Staphylococcus aureus]|nr:hypothetical protein I5D01_10685 [Staphylococcus aureus]
MTGWIKLHRKLLDHWLFKEKRKNRKEKINNVIDLSEKIERTKDMPIKNTQWYLMLLGRNLLDHALICVYV